MKRNRQSTCTKELTKRICILIEQGLSWSKIEQVVGKSRETLRLWQDKSSHLYQRDFDLAVRAARENYDCGQVRGGQFEQAVRHTLRKVTKERRLIDVRTMKAKAKLPPPKMPPQSFRRSQIISYADEILDLELDRAFTKGEMLIECSKRIIELSVEIMETTKQELVEVDPNQQAVKNVLTNCGPEKERWNFKEEHQIDTSDPLMSLIEKIASRPAPLPSEEVVNDERTA